MWIIAPSNADVARRCIVIVGALAAAWSAIGKDQSIAAPAAAQDRAACDAGRFRIAIDVGHTADSPGAKSAHGAMEYTFNLALAKVIEKTLKDGGFAQAQLLIVKGAGRAQLLARVARANALQLDLLVSIHHDDVQDRYHSRWQHNGQSYTYSDQFSGYSLFVSQNNKFPAASLAFAKLLGGELRARGLNYTPSHAEDIPGERRQLLEPETGVYRYDQLVVLKDTNAAAVLFEAGMIINRAEELQLASPERQSLVAGAMLAAVNGFCNAPQTKSPQQKR
ncbi:MAG: N-acetylmuramoyl-L-alanine amidase [Alphaproteobacteria bacterium]|jgi:N-acetylmuramoyl-L-alanine amidase|nr:N-acetylmuramoyl-L-alanine amidase [Alphaproteobacteria bacterium]